jgi:hypothetical protein
MVLITFFLVLFFLSDLSEHNGGNGTVIISIKNYDKRKILSTWWKHIQRRCFWKNKKMLLKRGGDQMCSSS